MNLTKQEQIFIKQNRDILKILFLKRIDELKEKMVIEKENRDRIADLIIELKYWLQDIEIFSKEKFPQKKKNEYI